MAAGSMAADSMASAIAAPGGRLRWRHARPPGPGGAAVASPARWRRRAAPPARPSSDHMVAATPGGVAGTRVAALCCASEEGPAARNNTAASRRRGPGRRSRRTRGSRASVWDPRQLSRWRTPKGRVLAVCRRAVWPRISQRNRWPAVTRRASGARSRSGRCRASRSGPGVFHDTRGASFTTVESSASTSSGARGGCGARRSAAPVRRPRRAHTPSPSHAATRRGSSTRSAASGRERYRRGTHPGVAGTGDEGGADMKAWLNGECAGR